MDKKAALALPWESIIKWILVIAVVVLVLIFIGTVLLPFIADFFEGFG